MKDKWKAITAIALACVLVAAIPGLSGSARAVDLDAECSLTVNAGSSQLAEDLERANVVLDLYKVADAVPVAGVDTYDYEMTEPYAKLEIPNEPAQEDWVALAQQAAEIALDGGIPAVAEAEAGKPVRHLEAGLYLIIARGKDLEDYVTTVSDEDEIERIATVAESWEYKYTYLPELVSLPGKPADENGGLSTSNPGDWMYEVTINLKPSQSSRLNSIEIVKNLTGFNPGGPATFVFSVEATRNGWTVYSDVKSMVFTQAGTQSITIDNLPIGADVTVTEIYSGASYSLETPGTQTMKVSAEEVASVSFTNSPTTEIKTGGSITNSFSYDEEGDWIWTPIPDMP